MKKYTGGMPKPRPAYANPKAPINAEGRNAITTVKPAAPRPRPAYKGVTGKFSTD